MSESTMARVAADRAAIERWEDEGGRALAREEPLRTRPGDLPSSDAEDGTSSGHSQARSERERAKSSSS